MSHFAKGNKSIEFIINCANEEFAQNGEKATLNSICQKHNISKGRMYHFFTSKEDLFYNCFKYSLSHIIDSINKFTIDESKSLERNLHNYYAVIINHWMANPDEIITIGFITETIPLLSQEIQDKITQYRVEWTDYVVDKFLQIINAKRIKMRINATLTKQLIIAIYQYLFYTFSHELINDLKAKNYARAEKNKENLLSYYDMIIDTFLNGVVDKRYKY